VAGHSRVSWVVDTPQVVAADTNSWRYFPSRAFGDDTRDNFSIVHSLI